ncbi:hypothetical protein [Streptomyces chartreusis]|uniref:hypothetical protein n=1 Tax=Streptomyces chartreusis TaxID=1969 RepID=UPI002F90DC43|nr:hypothetical protein OG938_44225 [Streptomyces chartreusis]WSZ73437.1 hypothetical protein OG938_47570 [Streptomyces chartreusis]WTA33697.1 hypothetical protein OIA45_48150 [Streptomyces chartreusis]
MATKAKRTAQEIAARKRAMTRALQLTAERRKREEELTGLAADFLMTRELEADVRGRLEEQIAALRAQAEAECVRLREQGAAVVAVMVARGEGAGRIAGRLGVGVGEVRLLRDETAVRGQAAGRRDGRGDGGVGAAVREGAGPSGVVVGVAGPSRAPVAGGRGAV